MTVSLEWKEGELFHGSSLALNTPEGRVRAGAASTMEAAGGILTGGLQLELRGIKVVRAFDSQVVLVSLRGFSDSAQYELIGSTTAPEGDLVEGGALAVLDAINRIMEKYARQEPPTALPP